MGKFSASRQVSKEQKSEIAGLAALGAKTKEIAQTLGLSIGQVRAQLKRDETQTLITQLKDSAFEKWLVAYHMIPETLAEDLQKAETLENRRAIREEIMRLIQIGDASSHPAPAGPMQILGGAALPESGSVTFAQLLTAYRANVGPEPQP